MKVPQALLHIHSTKNAQQTANMKERIALTELNAHPTTFTAVVHNIVARLKNDAEDVHDKHAAALRTLDGVRTQETQLFIVCAPRPRLVSMQCFPGSLVCCKKAFHSSGTNQRSKTVLSSSGKVIQYA